VGPYTNKRLKKKHTTIKQKEDEENIYNKKKHTEITHKTTKLKSKNPCKLSHTCQILETTTLIEVDHCM